MAIMKKNKKVTLFLLIIMCYCNCKNNEPSPRVILDYSLGSGWGYTYSIKVYNNGTSYLKRNSLERNGKSFFIKNKVNVNTLNAIASTIRERKLANRYEQQNVQDASFFNVIFYDGNGKPSKYYVYGHNYPQSLDTIKRYCESLERGKGWTPLKDTVITFFSQSAINSVPVIDSNMRFLPPLPRQTKH
jgi:hypothetical protein